MIPLQNHELVPVILTLSLFLITHKDVVDYVPENPSPRKGGRSHVCTHLSCCLYLYLHIVAFIALVLEVMGDKKII